LRARSYWADFDPGNARHNEEIVRLCGEATALDGDYASAWALLALASAELRFWNARPADARTPAERAMALDPRMPEAHCVRARLFEEQGENDAAETAIELALSLNVESWEANREAAQQLFRKGAVGEAIPFFEKAMAASPYDHLSAAMLVSCFDAIGDAAGARRPAEIAIYRAERAVICNPANGSAFASAATGLAALGERARARRWIRKALNVDPGNLAMRYALAATLASQFNDEEAALEVLDPFTEALTLPPHLRLLELDPSWASLRHSPRFQALVQRSRKRVNALATSRVTY
jgi:adenylate cyclase